MKTQLKTPCLSLLTLTFVTASGAAYALEAGIREAPAKEIAVPTADVSPQARAMIGAPLPSFWNAHPKDAAEWKALIKMRADAIVATLPGLREKFGVKSEQITVGGVNAYLLTPDNIPEQNRNRLLVHVHGGGYVFAPAESGTREGILMAGFGKFKVISIDYRMPPDFPYPAAMDDAMAVWKEVVKTNDPKKMAIFGTSTGGGMTMAMVLRAKKEGLPLPAATAPGTPWSDMTKTGDTYFTNEKIDNILVSNDGWLGDAAKLYANGTDLKDPQLSPVYGDLSGFPPTILTSGTRDLFLSNTVRVHRKLRQAGIVSDLHVFEGQSHAQYQGDPDAPEVKEHFAELTAFFDKYLGK
ncbi:MAG: epsilon-lactone hydrolase [Hyphomicrobiales bacterium]|jgi:acetyl esterase/lipase|nr:epsilon-lactone hydrolase [Hyphomicrobiales bacterium]